MIAALRIAAHLAWHDGVRLRWFALAFWLLVAFATAGDITIRVEDMVDGSFGYGAFRDHARTARESIPYAAFALMLGAVFPDARCRAGSFLKSRPAGAATVALGKALFVGAFIVLPYFAAIAAQLGSRGVALPGIAAACAWALAFIAPGLLTAGAFAALFFRPAALTAGVIAGLVGVVFWDGIWRGNGAADWLVHGVLNFDGSRDTAAGLAFAWAIAAAVALAAALLPKRRHALIWRMLALPTAMFAAAWLVEKSGVADEPFALRPPGLGALENLMPDVERTSLFGGSRNLSHYGIITQMPESMPGDRFALWRTVGGRFRRFDQSGALIDEGRMFNNRTVKLPSSDERLIKAMQAVFSSGRIVRDDSSPREPRTITESFRLPLDLHHPADSYEASVECDIAATFFTVDLCADLPFNGSERMVERRGDFYTLARRSDDDLSSASRSYVSAVVAVDCPRFGSDGKVLRYLYNDGYKPDRLFAALYLPAEGIAITDSERKQYMSRINCLGGSWIEAAQFSFRVAGPGKWEGDPPSRTEYHYDLTGARLLVFRVRVMAHGIQHWRSRPLVFERPPGYAPEVDEQDKTKSLGFRVPPVNTPQGSTGADQPEPTYEQAYAQDQDRRWYPEPSRLKADGTPPPPDLARGLPDPAAATEAEVIARLDAILPYATSGEENWAVREMALYVPRHLPLFLRMLSHPRPWLDRGMVAALALGTGEDQRADVIAALPQAPGISEAIVRRGWEADPNARAGLVALLECGSPLPLPALAALAAYDDPSLYPALLDRLKRTGDPALYEALRECRNIEPALSEALRDGGEHNAANALRHGVREVFARKVMATYDAVGLAGRENFDELLEVFSPERPVERDYLERLGLAKAMRDMVESGSYHFDPETRCFVPDQKQPEPPM